MSFREDCEFIKKTDILTSVSTDHSPIFFPFSKNPQTPKAYGNSTILYAAILIILLN